MSRLRDSYIFKDLKKYRRFGQFLHTHPELFTSLPRWTSLAAREMLTVNGVPKREKQKAIWQEFRRRFSLISLLRLLRDGWRSIK
jgi:electron transfer flavoprotein-quinone oxidoreductase